MQSLNIFLFAANLYQNDFENIDQSQKSLHIIPHLPMVLYDLMENIFWTIEPIDTPTHFTNQVKLMQSWENTPKQWAVMATNENKMLTLRFLVT